MDTDGIEQLLTCPICLETLRSPKMLLCQHSLCRDCLKRYVLSSGRDQFVLCPTCRVPTPLPDPGGTTGVDALPTSFVLNSLIDAVASRSPVATSAPGRRTAPSPLVPPAVYGIGVDHREVGLRFDDVRCDSCLQELQNVAAVMRCMDCDEFLCDACVKMHRRNKKSQQDELVPVSEYMTTAALASVNEYLAAAAMAIAPDDAASSGSQPANVGCGRHPNAAVTSFCTVCDCLVCTACVIAGCRPHRRVAVAEAADRARQRLMERCTRLRQLAGETMRQAAALDSSIATALQVERTVLNHLDTVRDALIAAVNMAHASASAPVRLSAEEDRCVMQSLLEEAQTQRLTLEGRADVLTAFLRPPPSTADADRRRVLVMDVRLLARFRDLETDAAAHESAAAAACVRFRPRRQLIPTFMTASTVRELIEQELARIFAIEMPQVADPSDELGNIVDGDTDGRTRPAAGAALAALFDSNEDDAAAPLPLHIASGSSGGWGGGISSGSIGNSSSVDAVSGIASDQIPSAAPAATSAAASVEEDTVFAARPSPSVERPRSLLLSSNAGSWQPPLSSDQPIAALGPLASVGSDEVVWRKICDIDTGRSCVRSIAFNIDGKLLAACDDGLKVAVREGISATLLLGDSSLVAVSDGGLIVVVLRAKRELRCYYQAGSCVAGPAPGSSVAGGGQLKLLWRRSLPQQKPSGSSSGGVSGAGGCALSLATQGDRVALLIDRALMLYRLADGNPVRTLRKAADGSLLFASTSAIALDHRGRVVAIECQGSCIRTMDDHGVTVWEHAGSAVSSSTAGSSLPRVAVEYSGLFVDASDDVYVTDSLNHEVVVLRASDRSIARTLRSSVPAHGLLHCPKHLAVYKRTVAVCHTSVHRISVFRLEDREQPVRRNNVSPECTV